MRRVTSIKKEEPCFEVAMPQNKVVYFKVLRIK